MKLALLFYRLELVLELELDIIGDNISLCKLASYSVDSLWL